MKVLLIVGLLALIPVSLVNIERVPTSGGSPMFEVSIRSTQASALVILPANPNAPAYEGEE